MTHLCSSSLTPGPQSLRILTLTTARGRGEGRQARIGYYFPVLQIRKLRHKWLPRCRTGIISTSILLGCSRHCANKHIL